VRPSEQEIQAGRILLLLTMVLLISCTGQNGRKILPEESWEVLSKDVHFQSDISFDTLSHDFGTILEGEMVVCYFEYENSGKGDLVITSVETTCGCTTPDWNKEPLKPGKRDQLKVVFDASGRSGSQYKSVAVESNAATSELRLTIRANVTNNK
jgi:uncharacterized protein DUF1573